MAHTTASLEVPVSADRAWQLIGGFNSLPDWLPYIPGSDVTEGGRLRHLRTVDGDVIVERLEAFDNKARSYTYSIVKAPFPAKDYVATIRVREAAGRQASVIEWSGSFTPVGVSDEEVTQLFQGRRAEGPRRNAFTLTDLLYRQAHWLLQIRRTSTASRCSGSRRGPSSQGQRPLCACSRKVSPLRSGIALPSCIQRRRCRFERVGQHAHGRLAVASPQ